MSKDYSQHGEQQVILDFFGPFIGRFLDIGAYDGIAGSNTRELSNRGWAGVCIEANPERFVELLKNHRGNSNISSVCGAMMPKRGLLEFYDCYSQCSTLTPTPQVWEHIRGSFHVTAFTASDLVSKFGARFEFVSLDVEGGDLPLLETMAPLLVHTRLLCVENRKPCQAFNAHYYNEMLRACAEHGFTRIIHKTEERDGISGNTLIASERESGSTLRGDGQLIESGARQVAG